MAQEPIGGFIEVFRTRLELDEDDVAARRLARVQIDRDLRLADVCSRRVLRFGVTAEMSSGGDYELSQALASRIAAAGYDGVRYWLRHDPAQRLVGVVLFGPAGSLAPEDELPRAPSRDLDQRLLDDCRRRFGYRVLPRP